MEIFFHGETQEGRGFTIAGVNGPSDEHIQLGLALCSEKDHLNKKLGRKIASGRAKRIGTVIAVENIKGQEGKVFRDIVTTRFHKKPARVLQTYFNL